MKEQTKKKDTMTGPPVKMQRFDVEPIQYKISRDSKAPLTREGAYSFLELKTFEGERPVREGHVQYLLDEFSMGRFLWHHVVIASAVLKGAEYRLNGQHTCWMRVSVPEKLEPLSGTDVRFLRYEVSSDEDLRSLYSAFDRNAPRTAGHVSLVQLMDTDAGRGLPSYIMTQLIAGFRVFHHTQWRHRYGSPNALVAAICSKEYASVFSAVGGFLSKRREEGRPFKRASVTGAMIATFHKSVKAAVEFWDPVCSGLGLEEASDPRHQLRKYLFTHGHSVVGGLEKVGTEDMYKVCLNMWNHWRKGRTVSAVKLLDERPKVL